MVLPRKINFTQMGLYSDSSEQRFRQLFEREFDWMQFNLFLMRQRFGESVRKAIAIDASYISKSGKNTPYIGKFWSGCASAKKRNIKVAVHYPESGGHKIYFSADLDMSAKDIIEYYRTRFQIEFCFRDSKQFTGLNDCQARDLMKLDFAFNASLASVNIAKVMRQRYYPSLSIGLLKAYLNNIYMLKRIFSKSDLKMDRTFNTKLIKELFGIVAEAA